MRSRMDMDRHICDDIDVNICVNTDMCQNVDLNNNENYSQADKTQTPLCRAAHSRLCKFWHTCYDVEQITMTKNAKYKRRGHRRKDANASVSHNRRKMQLRA